MNQFIKEKKKQKRQYAYESQRSYDSTSDDRVRVRVAPPQHILLQILALTLLHVRLALAKGRWLFLPHSSFVFSKRKLQKLCVGRWGPVSL